ncbi:MAG TPA: hypothetical protein VF950_00700 [Planctomycetota bacterium]
MAKRANDFIFVKGTQKLANQFNIKGSPAALIVDGDGAELARGSLAAGEPALTALFDKSAAVYASKSIDWASDVAASSKKLLVVGFETEGDTLKGFEDRMLAKYHDKISFVKLPYEKDSPTAKKWGVSTLPSIYVCDASKDAPEKAVIEKLTGAKKPISLKLAIQKALFKVEKK